MSQSLLIQRSYSYLLLGLVISIIVYVAIPSYSEVLFLLLNFLKNLVMILSRNPFLFRGPIPTWGWSGLTICSSRNPFLFRGPIPTNTEPRIPRQLIVAIPSYSEVLFLLRKRSPYLQKPRSQSLLIQRSYSYFRRRYRSHRC